MNPEINNERKLLFNPYDIVKNKIFGKGIVISVDNLIGDEEVIIKFDNISSPKRIIARFGSLENLNR